MDINEINKIIFRNKNTVNIVLPKENLFKFSTAKGKSLSNYSKIKNDLIHISKIEEDLYKLDDYDFDYITTSGNVYLYYGDGLFYKRSVYQNTNNKYMYVSVFKDGKNRQRRLHILLAKTFIPNKHSKYLRFVGHKNDIKYDNDLSNLYWTNNQENSKSANDNGLTYHPSAEENSSSIYVKVLDKNTLEIVGVYGSISECSRCIKNTTKSFIAKMCKIEGIYKPRSRKYIYQKASAYEFEKFQHLKDAKLIENSTVDKTPKVFELCNDILGYKEIFDNQVQASKVCGIPQAQISNMIKNGNVINGWYCIYKDSIKYIDSSSYENFINTINSITIENIYTKEMKVFKTGKELKKYFGMSAHDIAQYLKSGHTLMDEWKLISIDKKDRYIDIAA